VDTCCIDKSSSAELSEAINSMFAWYRDSAMCYVYLDIDTDAEYLTAEDFKTCRWTYRGWTLQELIAPSHVQFYSRFWLFLGTRQQLAQALHETTNIHISVLYRSDGEALDLASHCVARKMSWAAERQTTRPEDIAYAMFGLFGVHLPPLYGEGSEKAFLRLQHEILKSSRDLSILAWTTDDTSEHDEGALALTPNWFKGCETIVTFPSSLGNELVSTNNGLSVTVPLIEHRTHWAYTAILNCRYENDFTTVLGISLESGEQHEKMIFFRKPMWLDGKTKITTCRLDPDTPIGGNAHWKTINITTTYHVLSRTWSPTTLIQFEIDTGPFTLEILDSLRIRGPPIGFWDPENRILQMPEGLLEAMDIFPMFSFSKGNTQLPLFSLSIGPNRVERRLGLKSRKYADVKGMKNHRQSAILVIEGTQVWLSVSIIDAGFLKGQHIMEVLLHFGKHALEPQNRDLSRSETPQEDFGPCEPDGISVRIKKIWNNASAPLSSGSELRKRDSNDM
jgi:hypothetical protein